MSVWVRYRHQGEEGFGTLDGAEIRIHAGHLFATPTPTGARLPLARASLLAPVQPRRFIGL